MSSQPNLQPSRHGGAAPEWQTWRQRTEKTLDEALESQTAGDDELLAAMRYACLGGGKRVRALLVYAAGTVFSAAPTLLDAPAAAVEMIHAYSLIHDDLPAMDDDDLRRGKPACHRAFGEAIAILAGDALQPLAFELIANERRLSEMTRIDMVATLARAAGGAGMVCGQALDLAATGAVIDEPQLAHLHRHKTGALIKASVRLGALAGGATREIDFNALDRFADALGLAFQIVDDILDVEGSTSDLGKRQGSDRDNDKTTYVTLMGADEARLTTEKLRADALASLSGFGDNGAQLAALVDFTVSRRS